MLAPEEAKLIHTARNVNDYKPMYVVEKVKEKADRFKNPVIACLGLSFKANIDDLRESPAINIVEELISAQIGQINVVEPHIKELPGQLTGKIELVDIQRALQVSDIIVILVDHENFYSIDQSFLKEKIVIDTRGIFE